ncbi:DUF4185 domain-containing protein [Modestobacter sp. I12A-02628]|uniref:DUF4185 domain-containing protein n=1 Tax=Goekera deserti TaxID=2497753 RepID=A0A7K3WBV8_9ACTN|nr:DUF4185 domain-containing protein [Goekera deserti]MPQ98379.1 DUF4185 domain-containing protein [Goekera deserti]NDI48206.1 DUF4185 domain-containing protein [Goekera deserti]NEL53955.1 DUF4185 domain-containing protein [Goekera deserti]
MAVPPRVSADLVNQVVSQAGLPGWQAGDIGASARLSDGRLVWVFGDTVRAAGVSPRLVANSMLLSSGTCLSQLVAPTGGPVIPDAFDGSVRWPMSVAVLPPTPDLAAKGVTDAVVVLCARTRRGGQGGVFDYEFRGTSAAVFTVRAGGTPQLEEVVELTPDSDDVTQVNWGAAASVQGDWYYVYGTRLTGDPGVFGRELLVSRVPIAAPADRSRWEFWDGTGWQSDPARAAVVLPAAGGVSQTLSVDPVGDEWVAVSKRDGDLGDFVYSWTAPSPVGPWTPRRGIAAPAGYDTGQLTYAPLAHPEISLQSGQLLVSISRNTTDSAQLLADPEVGRPVFAEIPRP